MMAPNEALDASDIGSAGACPHPRELLAPVSWLLSFL